MRRIGSQKGEGKAGCLIWLLVVIMAAAVGSKVVPVKMASMKLEDHMKELAMTQPRQPQHFFEKAIFDKAKSLGLDAVRKEDVKVRKYTERVIMDVEFRQPIDIFSFTYPMRISIHIDRDIFLM